MLVASSFIFLTNVVNNYFQNDIIYSLLFFCLFITSIVYHSSQNIYANIIDKISILAVVLYGGNAYYEKIKRVDITYKLKQINTGTFMHFIPLFCFFGVIFLYCYGSITDQYCFQNNKTYANYCHAFLHIIVSIGHNIVSIL